MSSIFGFHTEGSGRNIAQRLSAIDSSSHPLLYVISSALGKRLNKPIFLSFSTDKNPNLLEEWVEKKLVDKLGAVKK